MSDASPFPPPSNGGIAPDSPIRPDALPLLPPIEQDAVSEDDVMSDAPSLMPSVMPTVEQSSSSPLSDAPTTPQPTLGRKRVLSHEPDLPAKRPRPCVGTYEVENISNPSDVSFERDEDGSSDVESDFSDFNDIGAVEDLEDRPSEDDDSESEDDPAATTTRFTVKETARELTLPKLLLSTVSDLVTVNGSGFAVFQCPAPSSSDRRATMLAVESDARLRVAYLKSV
jgi:hypothetical protein